MSRRGSRAASATNATGAAIVAATEAAVEADAAEAVRVTDEAMPATAAGAAVVAATEAVAATQAAEVIGTAEAVAAIVAPADAVTTPFTAAASVDALKPQPAEEEFVDMLEGAFTIEQIADVLRHAESVEPGHVQRLREALALVDGGTANTVPIEEAPVTVADSDRNKRRFRLVSAIVGDTGTVAAGEWVTLDQDEHATLRRGLSVDWDWDGGLPL